MAKKDLTTNQDAIDRGIQKKRKKTATPKKTFWPPWPEREEAVKLYEAIRKKPLTDAIDYIKENPPSPGTIWFLIFEAMERNQSDLGRNGRKTGLEKDPLQQKKPRVREVWLKLRAQPEFKLLKTMDAELARIFDIKVSLIGTWRREWEKEDK